MRLRARVLALVLCLGAFFCSCQKAPQAQLHVPGKKILYYQDPMHPSYRSERPGIAPDCNMELVPVYADAVEGSGGPPLVRVDKAQAAAMGLRTEAARDEALSGEVRTVGRVQTSESRKYQVTAGDDGWIRSIHGGETGAFVVKGQPLASYYSRDIASPQQAYLYALDSHEQARTSDAALEKELAAKQLVQARDYLEFLGMTDRQIADLEHIRQESRELTLGAPAAGVILERRVSAGTRFAKGDVLWEIGDIESVWIIADLFPEDLALISGTRNATAVLPDGSEYDAAVDSSLPRFDAAERVAKLRLTVKNTENKLLPGMTVTVRLQKKTVSGLTVPAESVIESGIRPRVFVRHDDGSFEARAVTTGWRNAGRLQILSGLQAGEQVAVAGAFLIDSESRINEDSR
jgi:membrane fusion protein, copper/silver efflux system